MTIQLENEIMIECDHSSRTEFLDNDSKRTQKCHFCEKERIYNPLKKSHLIQCDPDIWSEWK